VPRLFWAIDVARETDSLTIVLPTEADMSLNFSAMPRREAPFLYCLGSGVRKRCAGWSDNAIMHAPFFVDGKGNVKQDGIARRQHAGGELQL